MKQTSAHFQPVKGGSEEHNERQKKLDYVFHDRTLLNEVWKTETQAERMARCREDVKQLTGRAMQAKAKPLQEFVVVIDEKTSMDDLKRLSEAFKSHFNIEVFQIAIHRDEGYKNGSERKLNLHAHLVADFIDHTNGKTKRMNRQDCRDLQTITAQVLGMARGIPSDKKHLDAMQFKNHAEEQRNAALKAEGEKLEEQRKEKAAAANKEHGSAILSGAASLMGAIGEGAAAMGRGARELWQVSTNGKLEKELKRTKESVPQQIAAAKAEGKREAERGFCEWAAQFLGIQYNDREKAESKLHNKIYDLQHEAREWKDVVDRQAAKISKLEAQLSELREEEQQQEQRGWGGFRR